MNPQTTSNWRFVFQAMQRDLQLWNKALIELQTKRTSLYFKPNMTIEQAIQFHPQAYVVLQKFGFPKCKKCSVRFEESLQEASDAYDINLHQVLFSLNQLLQKTKITNNI